MRILVDAAHVDRRLSCSQQSPSPWSFDKTMRVDYFHTGGPKSGETVALDRVVNDGAWPGSRTQLVDTTSSAPTSSRCVTRHLPT